MRPTAHDRRGIPASPAPRVQPREPRSSHGWRGRANCGPGDLDRRDREGRARLKLHTSYDFDARAVARTHASAHRAGHPQRARDVGSWAVLTQHSRNRGGHRSKNWTGERVRKRVDVWHMLARDHKAVSVISAFLV